MAELYKFNKKSITIKNCSEQQGMQLLTVLTQKDFHRFNSHGGWVEFNNVSYFVIVQTVNHDKITIISATKKLNRKERMFFKY